MQHRSSPDAPLWLHDPDSGFRLKPLHKLGKLLGFKTGSGTVASSSKELENSDTNPNSSSLPLLGPVATLLPEPSYLDEGNSYFSEKTPTPDFHHQRTLNHSISTPVMCTRHQCHSEATTRAPSPVMGSFPSAPLELSLRAHTFPVEVDEKARSKTTTGLLSTRWKWRKRTGGRNTSAFPSATPASGSMTPRTSYSLPSSAWDAEFKPSPPLSTYFPSTSTGDLQLVPIMSSDSLASDDLDYRERPSQQQRRRQSIHKLARTLGVFPQDFLPVGSANKSPDLADAGLLLSHSHVRGGSKLRRMSLSLTTTFNTMPELIRPPSRSQASRSRISLSTLNTDDVHQFGLDDELSDSWGEIREDSRLSIHSSNSPISPITFKPPTPVAVVPSKRLSSIHLPSSSTDNMKPEVTRASSPLNATLSRSRSMPFAQSPPRLSRLAQLASAHNAESRPPSPLLEEPTLPYKANWLESPTHEEAVKAKSFMISHPEYTDEYKNWTGQWNQNDMQDVIRMLRTLK